MPRNVRNWWIEGNIDGRKSALSGGPVSKDGGIDITIYQRDKGQVLDVLIIKGIAHDGVLKLEVTNTNDPSGQDSFEIKTER